MEVRTAALQESADAAQPRKPTAKQIYCAAHLMADMLGLTWPTDRRSASDLIQRLKSHADAEPVASSAEPF